MMFEGEVTVQHDSEVADVWAGGRSGVVDGEAEVLMREFGQMMIMLDSSQLSLRKLVCIHNLRLCLLLVRVDGMGSRMQVELLIPVMKEESSNGNTGENLERG